MELSHHDLLLHSARRHLLPQTAYHPDSLSGIIIFMIVRLLRQQTRRSWGAFDFYTHLNYDNPGTSLCIAIFWSVIFLALAAFSLWASYKLFTRMQVICNKWINI